MPNKAEIKYAGEFLASEANGERSRDTVTLLTGTVYQPGDVLGKITATGKYTLLTQGANDGSQNAAAINYAHQDASGADVAGAPVILRSAEVNGGELNYNGANAGQITTANGQLASLGIIVRTGKG